MTQITTEGLAEAALAAVREAEEAVNRARTAIDQALGGAEAAALLGLPSGVLYRELSELAATFAAVPLGWRE